MLRGCHKRFAPVRAIVDCRWSNDPYPLGALSPMAKTVTRAPTAKPAAVLGVAVNTAERSDAGRRGTTVRARDAPSDARGWRQGGFALLCPTKGLRTSGTHPYQRPDSGPPIMLKLSAIASGNGIRMRPRGIDQD